MAEPDDMSLAEAQAFRLTQCAIALNRADDGGGPIGKALTSALLDNLETWIAMKTLVESVSCGYDNITKSNLTRLCTYVFDKTIACRDGIAP